MKRLIVTHDSSAAGGLKVADLADIAIPVGRRLVWGPLPSETELAAFFEARTNQKPAEHWLDFGPTWRLERFGIENLGFVEVCERSETVELWFDPEPNGQLQLIWLLGSELFAVLCECRFEADFNPSGRRHCQPTSRSPFQMAAASCQNPERSSRSRQHGLAGLSTTDAAALVQSARQGSQRPTAATADRAGTARRTSDAHYRARRDGNADTRADIERWQTSI